MDDIEILNRFLKVNLNIHPDIIDELRKSESLEDTIDWIISEVCEKEDKPSVITLDYIDSLKSLKRVSREGGGVGKVESSDNATTPTQATDTTTQEKFQVLRAKKRPLAQEYEANLLIDEDMDITNKSFSSGDIEGFIEYFNDRFEVISGILKERNHLREAMTIEWIKGNSYRENVKVIGIVNDKIRSKKGHVIVEIEDPTGAIPVLILNTNRELLDIAENLVQDEIIGIEGNVGRNNDIIIAREIYFPDIPTRREISRSEDPLAIAMISDLHIGSTEFLEDAFSKFIYWLNGEIGNEKQRMLAGKVKYLAICGDVVDGVGIYPGQENELLIKDLHEQYGKFSSFIERMPDYIEIIIIPGNHDATRQAEPQPAIMEKFVKELYDDNRIHMAGNPCKANIHGVNVLMYHGRSLDDMVSCIQNFSYAEPEKPMIELLKKRHLAPVFGGKVPLSPESKDYMIIDEVPDIMHVGHVHTVGVASYRGTTLINSGAFQKQTSFQRKQNIKPDPARVPIIDLQTHKTIIMKFI